MWYAILVIALIVLAVSFSSYRNAKKLNDEVKKRN